MRDLFIVGTVLVALFAVVVGGIFLFKSAQCHARWAHTERQTEWGVFSRCLVESNGKLVPEDRVWYERNQ